MVNIHQKIVYYKINCYYTSIKLEVAHYIICTITEKWQLPLDIVLLLQ